MTTWIVVAASLALLALLAVAAVRLKPSVESGPVAPVIHSYPAPRKSVERVLGVRGPSLASATRGLPIGATGIAMPMSYGYPYGAVGSGALPYASIGTQVFALPECRTTEDGWRVVLKSIAYRATADERGRIIGIFEEATGTEVGSSTWNKVRDIVEDFERRREASLRRQKWAAGS